jgi:hypothetical protein
MKFVVDVIHDQSNVRDLHHNVSAKSPLSFIDESDIDSITVPASRIV